MNQFTFKNLASKSTMMKSAKRHFQTIIKYMTVRKAINIFISVVEMSFIRSRLISHPFYLRIEVSPICNLVCPGCLLGGAKRSETNPEHRNGKVMSLELFKKSVEYFIPYLIKVNLYDEGEPLLNRQIPKMISHLKRNKVATCVSSNFSFKISDNYMRELLQCGLDHLIVALDGATQESYATYRKGGNIALVIGNLERLVSMRNELESTMKIEIQFLEFRHNKDEKEGVFKIAQELDVWRFTVIENCSTQGWEGKRFKGTKEERRKRGCYQLWIATTITSVGEIGCCDYGEDHGIPNIGLASDYSSQKLRNCPSIIKLRQSFRYNSKSLNPICCHCSLYKQ